MTSRRLTKSQKDEIVEAYRGGEKTNTLAEKYSCSSNTINRTVKKVLSDSEFKLIKEKRLKNSNKKVESVHNKSFDITEDYFEQSNCSVSSKEKINEEKQSITTNGDLDKFDFEEIAFLPMSYSSPSDQQNDEDSDAEEINRDISNKFEEILPLPSSFDLEEKELDFEILNQEILPESVYMIVDKKVELEVKSISDLPEWGFLPKNELERKAILLFSNQRNAKRSCSRNQRVIKIPNTSIFQISKSYLFSKGITRLILDESIIALDN